MGEVLSFKVFSVPANPLLFPFEKLVSPVHCGTAICLRSEQQSRANTGVRIPLHPNSAFPSVSSLLSRVSSTRKHLPTQDGTQNPPLPIFTGEEPSVGGPWSQNTTSWPNHFQREDALLWDEQNPEIPHPPERSPNGQPGEGDVPVPSASFSEVAGD